jgi:hypothetical protein
LPTENPPNSPQEGFFARIGVIRILLSAMVIATLPMAWIQHLEPVGWAVIPVYVAPGIIAFMVWGLLFDILMASVFRSAKPASERAHYTTVIRLNGALILAVFISWGPFFVALFSRP